jgi:hypothetical protein
MPQSEAIRILLIGRTLPVHAIDCLLSVNHLVRYTCVENLAAAEWLMADGYDAELIIAEAALYHSAEHMADWRDQNSSGLFLVGADCNFEALKPRLNVLLDICGLRRIPIQDPAFDLLISNHQKHAQAST